ADAQPAIGRGRDLVECEAVDVDQVRRRLDVELHQVEQVGAAGDELRTGDAARGRGRIGRRLRAFVAERSHAFVPATSLIASMMFEYAPQRQMLPLMRSRSSAAVTCGAAVRSALTWLGMPALISPSTATAEQIWPGVQ